MEDYEVGDLESRVEEVTDALENAGHLLQELEDGSSTLETQIDELTQRKEKVDELHEELTNALDRFRRGY